MKFFHFMFISESINCASIFLKIKETLRANQCILQILFLSLVLIKKTPGTEQVLSNELN